MAEGAWQWLTPWFAIIPWVMLLGFYLWRLHEVSLEQFWLSIRLRFKHPLMNQLPESKSKAKQYRRQGLLLLWVVSMLSLALAQPVKLGEKLPDLPPERDIVLLVDVSISMRLTDYEIDGKDVSRLAVLKQLIGEFVSKTNGERLAVVVFAERPYVLTPLTYDPELIKSQVMRLTTTLAGRVSALGDAILLALKEAGKQPQRKQIMVLFTDANNSIGKATPTAAAELARAANIPIYPIAIGSSALEGENAKTGLLYQPVNVEMLQSLAQQTGGVAFEAADAQTIENALQAISQLQKNEAAPKPYYTQTPLYFWFLLLAILPLLILQIGKFLLTHKEQSA